MSKKLAVAFGLALALTLSCSDDTGGSSNTSTPVRKEKISGVSQKGPFIGEADVIIYELDADRNKTKKSFPGKTKSDGSFEINISGGTLASQYILLEVNGIYVNEVSGEPSNAPITLYAVADVSDKDNVNINVFTHLEYNVLELASNTPFRDAKKAAQKKVLYALGMNETEGKNSEDMNLFGGSKSDSILLAASILLQGDRSTTEEVKSLLATIGSDIKGIGILSPSTKSEVASGVANLNMSEVAERIRSSNPTAKVPSPDDINNIVEEINNSKASVTFTDPRDSKAYKVVQIGSQTWMAENLNFNANGSKCYGEGGPVLASYDEETDNYKDTITLSKTEIQANCDKYGRLYNWETAKRACPTGWHLPSNVEWNALMTFAGGAEKAGRKLKAASGWNEQGGGTDEFGFTALPGGAGVPIGYFFDMGEYSLWWSSSTNSFSNAYFWSLMYDFDDFVYGPDDAYDEDDGNKNLISVRCVKD